MTDETTSDPSQETPPLTTVRLRLRARVPDDAAALFAEMSDPEAMAWWSRAPFVSEAELRARFATRAKGRHAWAITRPGEDRALGFVVAGERPQGGVSEIGYLLARHAQGQGLAQEAVAGVIGHLFARGQRRVFADCDPENAASIALLERLGFRREGRLRAEWHTHMGLRDSLIYGLLASDWAEGA
ncbi:GNAT family N-acetyltransferase [Limimaricola litoreus]|uniref:GNAT family N-acetyltransferase n=1 Tax=Limimaricola litoreus TaxID=2955316 RepID=A0A9X2JPS5_9RHOB|nr:GNAT family protein [Limimaricola litoreus]MCP1169199.1 GNAT family N-acetyltransferase [Limimaricola litoreus]